MIYTTTGDVLIMIGWPCIGVGLHVGVYIELERNLHK